MKSFGIIAASVLFGAVANAVPLNKRAVVWVTETDVDVVTVAVTKTVWVGSEETTASTASTTSVTRHQHHQFNHKTSATSSPASTSTSSHVKSSSTTPVYVALSSTSSTSVYTTPASSTSTSVYVPPPSTSSTSTYVESTSSTSVYVPLPTTSSTSTYVPSTTSTSIYVEPTTPIYQPTSYAASTTSTSSAAPAQTSASSGSGASGLAAPGTEYSGDLTYYATGQGACGWVNADGDHIVAISTTIYDAYTIGGNPNNNALCGKYITIKGKDGQAHQAKVVDRCQSCLKGDLDLDESFFNLVTAGGNGRESGMEWSWN